MLMTSGTIRPISPPVKPANTTTRFCRISTATSVVRPKYGPVRRSAGNASTMPPATAIRVPRTTQAQIGKPCPFRIPAP